MEKMVNYFIYAKDFSGSTGDCKHYHSNGMKTVEAFKNDVEKIEKELASAEPPAESKIIYLHWGDRCYQVDENETLTSYKNLSHGAMGTEPVTIIKWVKQNYIISDDNKIKLLYIITDGMIDHRSAEKCFDLNDNIHYETVVFHAFNEFTSNIDLSVAASFFKSRCKVYRNYELCDNVNISEDFDYNKINIKNFDEEKENMKSYIKLKFIKKVKNDALALREIEKLKKFRRRLFIELESDLKKHKSNLNTRDKNLFLREFVKTNWYKYLVTPNHGIKVEIEKTISTLINYIVNDKKSFSFDALKFNRKFDNPVEEEPIVDVDFAAEEEIEFPDIILDDDKGIPVIILAELNLLDKIIFHKTETAAEVSPASFNKFKTTMECPLFLCNDTDISDSIGYFYTLNVYKQLLENDKKTEPRTRRPFHGGLVLTETDEFDKYNDFILSATYFNFKKVNYNKGLFYYVLWKNCENKEWMDRNVVERFKKYVMRRVSNTVCKVGLSSLPLDPPEITSLPTALWYCVELSSCLFKHDYQNFSHERLRMYYGVADHMIDILKHFNYDLDIKSIDKRIDMIRHVTIVKKKSKQEEKVYFLLEKIFKNVNGFLVSEIDKPFNLNKLNYLKLNHKCWLRDDVTEKKVHLNDYVHLMHIVGRTGGEIDICQKTLRPFFAIDENKSFYTELVEATRKVVINNDDDQDKINITDAPVESLDFDRILSLYNLFIRCVQDNKKYPTLGEYMEYISKRKKYHGEFVTIFPPSIYSDAENVYRGYQSIVTKVDVKKFIYVSKSYVTRTKRVKAEEVVKFQDSSEIAQYISRQESKVGLKKKDRISSKYLFYVRSF